MTQLSTVHVLVITALAAVLPYLNSLHGDFVYVQTRCPPTQRWASLTHCPPQLR